MQGGGGSPEQSQRVVFGYQLDENYSQTSARRGRPRSYAQARALAFNAKGEKPAEPVPYLVPSDWTTKNPYCHSELVSESVPRCKLVPNIGQTLNQVQGDNRLLACVGFTMAEILLSLTIIGVVAAITLPSLTGNINERTWNTQRKALYARFSQALPLMGALNAYGTLTEDETGSVTEDNVAETFITSGLSKVLKVNNICDNEHLEDCGVASKITNLTGTQIDLPTTTGELNSLMVGTHSTDIETFSLPDAKAAAFETQNGESIVVYYNNRCLGSLAESPLGIGGIFMTPKICANFIYDLNGNKGPNTVGKDIGFMTAMYPYDATLVAPQPAPQQLSGTYSQTDAIKACTNYDSEYRLPSADELTAIFANKRLMIDGDSMPIMLWSSTTISANKAYAFAIFRGDIDDHPKSGNFPVWCIKR